MACSTNVVLLSLVLYICNGLQIPYASKVIQMDKAQPEKVKITNGTLEGKQGGVNFCIISLPRTMFHQSPEQQIHKMTRFVKPGKMSEPNTTGCLSKMLKTAIKLTAQVVHDSGGRNMGVTVCYTDFFQGCVSVTWERHQWLVHPATGDKFQNSQENVRSWL